MLAEELMWWRRGLIWSRKRSTSQTLWLGLDHQVITKGRVYLPFVVSCTDENKARDVYTTADVHGRSQSRPDPSALVATRYVYSL
jgi:hypothetical protein